MRRLLTTLTPILLTLLLALAGVAGCDADDGDDPGCPAEGALADGLRGVVLTPNCAAPLSDATVTALHGTGATITVQTNAAGEFVIPSSQLAGNLGRWGISATKGPFNTPRVDVTVADDGTSGFVVLQASQ